MDESKKDMTRTYVMNKNIHSRATMVMTYYDGNTDLYVTTVEAMPVFTYRIKECRQTPINQMKQKKEAMKYHYEMVAKIQAAQTGEPGVMKIE